MQSTELRFKLMLGYDNACIYFLIDTNIQWIKLWDKELQFGNNDFRGGW